MIKCFWIQYSLTSYVVICRFQSMTVTVIHHLQGQGSDWSTTLRGFCMSSYKGLHMADSATHTLQVDCRNHKIELGKEGWPNIRKSTDPPAYGRYVMLWYWSITKTFDFRGNSRQICGLLHATQTPASLQASAYAATAVQKHSQSPPVSQAHESLTQAS